MCILIKPEKVALWTNSWSFMFLCSKSGKLFCYLDYVLHTSLHIGEKYDQILCSPYPLHWFALYHFQFDQLCQPLGVFFCGAESSTFEYVNTNTRILDEPLFLFCRPSLSRLWTVQAILRVQILQRCQDMTWLFQS
jgi:hypothetical protein